MKRKVSKLGEIIKDLEESHRISEQAADMLSGFAETSVVGDLYHRYVIGVLFPPPLPHSLHHTFAYSKIPNL